jgi:hypothetical protein
MDVPIWHNLHPKLNNLLSIPRAPQGLYAPLRCGRANALMVKLRCIVNARRSSNSALVFALSWTYGPPGFAGTLCPVLNHCACRRSVAGQCAALAQLVRALDCGSRGPPFKPGRRYHSFLLPLRPPHTDKGVRVVDADGFSVRSATKYSRRARLPHYCGIVLSGIEGVDVMRESADPLMPATASAAAEAQLSQDLVARMDAFIAEQMPAGPERDIALRKLISDCLSTHRLSAPRRR